MKIFLSFISIILLALCAGCSDGNVTSSDPPDVIGSGNIITEMRTLVSFNSFTLRTVADINITFGTEQSFSITADDNVAEIISTTVVDDVLEIGTENDLSFETDTMPVINMTMTDLQALTLTGVGTITGQNRFVGDNVAITLTGVADITLELEVDQLSTTLTGVGNVELSGFADKHDAILTSVAVLRAFELVTNTTIITLTGVATAEVNANNSLSVTLAGAGSLFYKGNPSVGANISGTGSIIDANQ